MGKSHAELEAENARLTKRLEEATRLLDISALRDNNAGPFADQIRAFFSPPPTDSPVLCTQCRGPHGLIDVVLPRKQWEQIWPEIGGILCATCIVARAATLPHVVSIAALITFADDYDGERTPYHEVTALAARYRKESADSPVLSTPVPVDPPLPGLSREDAAIARERINPTPRWSADSPVAADRPAGYCGKAHKTVFGGFVCNRTDLHESAKCAWHYERWTPPVAPGPIDVEARLKALETHQGIDRFEAQSNANNIASHCRRLEVRIDELVATADKAGASMYVRCATCGCTGGNGSWFITDEKGKVITTERCPVCAIPAAPPAPVAEPGTCTELTCRYYGQRHATAHEPRDEEAAEAGHAFVCVTKDPQGRDCTSWCRCECGEYKGAPIHAMAKGGR